MIIDKTLKWYYNLIKNVKTLVFSHVNIVIIVVKPFINDKWRATPPPIPSCEDLGFQAIYSSKQGFIDVGDLLSQDYSVTD